MDIQYVLDVYACAMYIVSYISKAQRGMSELLRTAYEEAKSGNSSVKQQVRDIGNKFLNAVEISAQEAVYLALQLPMRRSSREVVFIPSSPPDERIQLLKSVDEIKEMEDESEEIETGSLIKRYIKRPDSLENVTLADWTAWYDIKSNGKNIYQKSCKEDNDGLLLETQDEDNLEDDYESRSDELTESKTPSKVIKKRGKCRIIRSVRFNKKSMRKSTLESCYFFLVLGEMKDVILKVLGHLNRDVVKLVNRLIANWQNIALIVPKLMKQ